MGKEIRREKRDSEGEARSEKREARKNWELETGNCELHTNHPIPVPKG
jgi:hypothetical protein